MSNRGWLALLPIGLWALSGCTSAETTRHTSWLKRFNEEVLSPHHALLKIAMINRPWQDEYINQQLWRHTDEMVVGDLERHHLLHSNGFRIGQLVSVPPYEFQQMLLDHRYCTTRAMIFPAGKTMQIPLSPVWEQASYEIALDKNKTITLDEAQFCLDVTANAASGGRTKLSFVPKVEHGGAAPRFQPVSERSQWELRTGKANHPYPELNWEVTLGPNQYLLIGCRTDRPRRFGQIALSEHTTTGSVQRLLVVWNCRSIASTEGSSSGGDDLQEDRTPPLAIQATLPGTHEKTR